MNLYKEVYNANFISLLRQQFRYCGSVLDVGCGLGLLWDHYDCNIIVAMDIHRPYLENLRKTSAFVLPIVADARQIGSLLMPRSVDAVALIDSLEHLSKGDARKVLSAAEKIARQRVVIFTPRGFFPQESLDNYGLKGEKFQTHQSGWEPEEFMQRGYRVIVLKGFHNAQNASFRAAFGENAPPVDAILAYKIIKDK
ncbi:class I SAM-dependent methyltransferase [Paenibacillus physcomitrellae]|uniref:Methyltransferase n=1 Tax=Paenibacillus physcomitrellae TaxID=1619311 RepID=A0ABQ1G249_9BACL|nr:class I SAM-dependent methyltransferase [Paenibacillus physcomitrellae]GGA35964.1 methyltransferase [Paenibacillus physcomitrellae]